MKQKLITINDNRYFVILENNLVNVIKMKNGMPQEIDPNFATDELKKQSADAIVDIIKEEMIEDIKKGKYNSIYDVEDDFKSKLKDLETPLISKNNKFDFTNLKEFSLSLNELEKAFEEFFKVKEKRKDSVTQKAEMDLNKLFKENGITEYEINPSSSIITFIKDGIPHTITNTNPNESIYDRILAEMKPEDLNNKESVNNGVKNALDTIKTTELTQNETISLDKADSNVNEIANYLKNKYNIQNIYGIKPVDNSISGKMMLVNLGNGWQPIVINKDETGKMNITFGEEKQIDNTKTISNQNLNEDNLLKEELDNQVKNNQIKETFVNYTQNNKLTNEQIEILKEYGKSENYNNLDDDAKECYNLLTSIESDELEDEKINENNLENVEYENNLENEEYENKQVLSKPKVKTLTMNNKIQNAFTDPLFLTFLSGVMTGLLVFTITKFLV